MAKQDAGYFPGGGGGGGFVSKIKARISGGITGAQGSNVTRVYQESIPPASVKVRTPMTPGLRKAFNDRSTLAATRAKSGKAAKTGAADKMQSMKIEKEKAHAADMQEIQRILAKGGKVIKMPTKKSVTRNGVAVLKRPIRKVKPNNN